MEKIEEIITASRKVVGTKQVLRGVAEGTIRCVIVASDADSAVKDTVIGAAEKKGVPVRMFHSMEEMGKLSGLEVAAACVGVLD